MKTKIFKLTGAIFLAGLFTFTACNEQDKVTEEEELSTETVALVNESALTGNIEEELDASINEAVAYSEQQGSTLKSATVEPECATVTVSPDDGTFPKTITIDFGEGCEGPRGFTRSGIITITITDTLRNPGAEYQATFENFAIGDFSLTGTKSVENTGTENAPSFAEEVSISLTTPNGIVIDKTKSTTREWVEGMDTYGVADDVFLLSGSAQVSSSAGRSYSYTILEPLKAARTCKEYLEGVIEITWSGKDEPVTIDFGDGECDRKVYVSHARRRIHRRAVFLDRYFD
jgi:hypothetical protein